MDVRMAAALPDGVGGVAAFCRVQGISRQTYYKWRRRFEVEGLDGLRERSRRPRSSPTSTPAGIEEAIVRVRKRLADDGEFNGPLSVRDRLLADGELDTAAVPSRATIARILARRGQVRPQPRKRPRSSYRRFEADRPNEMWQSDWTEWRLGAQPGGKKVAIAATLDDHSRLLVAITAGSGDGTAELVWAVMATAISNYGVPMSSLTDNGLCYSTRHRGDGQRPAAFETNLAALGCQPIASSPYHPQTCGKIERFWQTLKKWLRARETSHGPRRSLAHLNTDLATFAEHYNTRRPHRALGGRTPAAAFAATTAARPINRPLPSTIQTYRRHVSTGGSISVAGPPAAIARQLRVHLGARYQQLPVTVLQDGIRVAVFTGNTLIRALDLDTNRLYQPLNPTNT